ncbi:MAG: metallophosphoesterase family protein [Candidatus Saccharicenans sp.]
MKKIIYFIIFGLLLLGPVFGSEVKFVVISDTNPDFGNQNDFSLFEKEINQINALKPDLVINMGDLIYGYGLKKTRPQWQKYLEVISKIESPYYQIPGNHDIFSKKSREIYLDIFKKTYTSFDFKNYHFILLDNLDGAWGRIGPEQLDWLEKDLANPKWTAAFVFMHIPVWDLKTGNLDLEWREFWFNKIHPLLLKSKVKAVFAGHSHRFGPIRIYDGIHYYVAGGGGPRLHSVYVKHGGRNFFLLVEASDNGYQVKVVMENRIASEQEADILKEIFAPYYFRPGKDYRRK